jgi:hypothetical protein
MNVNCELGATKILHKMNHAVLHGYLRAAASTTRAYRAAATVLFSVPALAVISLGLAWSALEDWPLSARRLAWLTGNMLILLAILRTAPADILTRAALAGDGELTGVTARFLQLCWRSVSTHRGHAHSLALARLQQRQRPPHPAPGCCGCCAPPSRVCTFSWRRLRA